MPHDHSEFYFVEPMKVTSRLDFEFNHPKYEKIEDAFSKAEYAVHNLADNSILKETIVSGKTPERYVYPESGIPFLGGRNIHDGFVDLSNCDFVSEELHESMLAGSNVQNADVLVTMAGVNVGRTGVYESDEEANINQAIARLRPSEKVNPKFLCYFLNSRIGSMQFRKNRHDVGQPNINTDEIGQLRIILPPRDIQDKIVERIREIEKESLRLSGDAHLELSNALNAIVHILGFELPPKIRTDYFYITPDELAQSRLDYIANEPWHKEVIKSIDRHNPLVLDALIEPQIEYGINDYGREFGRVPFINIENLTETGNIDLANVHYLDYEPPQAKALRVNDVLISRSRLVGRCSFVTEQEANATWGSYILRMRLKEDAKVSSEYLVNYVNSPLGQAQIDVLKGGSVGTNINPNAIRAIKVIVPNKDQHAKVAQTLQSGKSKARELAEKGKEKMRNAQALFEKFVSPSLL